MYVMSVEFNPTVGDIENNINLMVELMKNSKNNPNIFVFPECSTTGYPLGDLVERVGFIEQLHNYENKILEFSKTVNYHIVYGTCDFEIENNKRKIFNQLRVIHNGKIIYKQNKINLPNYGVFDEKRNFVSGNLNDIKPIQINNINVGFAICEDIWQNNVVNFLDNQKTQLLITINGSPFEVNKQKLRMELIANHIKNSKNIKHALYVNIGTSSQDDIIFDGGSFDTMHEEPFQIFDCNSNPIRHTIFDIGKTFYDFKYPEYNENWQIYNAMVIGMKDYFKKQNFKTAVLGLSGGVDSALVAKIAADALGPQNVYAIRLPSKFSSKHSLNDAEQLAKKLKINLETVAIEPIVNAIRSSLEPISVLTGIADENIQSRARMIVLMALSNQFGHIVLGTTNKSELAVGYGTIFGDSVSGFNSLKDIYKTRIFEICKWINHSEEIIPNNIITKPPSAELRENQVDSQSLPEYDVLDTLLELILEKNISAFEFEKYQNNFLKNVKKEIAEKCTVELYKEIAKKVMNNEYKRRFCNIVGAKVSNMEFGTDRRFPIINKFKE